MKIFNIYVINAIIILPGSGYLHSENGVLCLWHLLVNLYIYYINLHYIYALSIHQNTIPVYFENKSLDFLRLDKTLRNEHVTPLG